jgi:hypothetical protein
MRALHFFASGGLGAKKSKRDRVGREAGCAQSEQLSFSASPMLFSSKGSAILVHPQKAEQTIFSRSGKSSLLFRQRWRREACFDFFLLRA